MALRAMLLVALAACGDNLAPPPPPDGIASGTRLRARFFQDAEGARMFESFHDVELGADCTFRGDPPRCLPEVAHIRNYLNAVCSRPLFRRGIAGECTTLPEFVGIAGGDDEFERTWRLGERIDPVLVFRIEGGFCGGNEPRTDTEYYAVDVEIPAQGFVAATSSVSGEGRLAQVALVTDDGARLPVRFYDRDLRVECSYHAELGACLPDVVGGDLAPLERVAEDDLRRLQGYYIVGDDARLRTGGFHDRVRNLDCEPVQTGPERWHCLPEMGVPATRLFADSLCEQPVDVFEERPGDPPGSPEKPRRGLVWREPADSPCERHAHVYQRGDELDSGSLYEPRLYGCQRLTWSADEVRRFALGPAIELDEYVELRRVTE